MDEDMRLRQDCLSGTMATYGLYTAERFALTQAMFDWIKTGKMSDSPEQFDTGQDWVPKPK